MDDIKISVLVPIYNAEKYLRECVQSVLEQTYHNWELVLLNDGSGDHSEEICLEYQKKDVRIRYCVQDNHGLSYTRKKLFSMAEGDYAVCLDADDYLRNDALERIAGAASKTMPDMLMYFYSLLYTDHILKVIPGGDFLSQCKDEYTDKNEFMEDLLTTDVVNSLCIKAVSKKLVRELGGIKIEPVNRQEDLMVSFILVNLADKIEIVKEPFYYYRQRRNSMIHVTEIRDFEDVLHVWRRISNTLNTENRKLYTAFQTMEARVIMDMIKQCNKSRKQITEKVRMLDNIVSLDGMRELLESKDLNIGKKNQIRRQLLMNKKYRMLIRTDMLYFKLIEQKKDTDVNFFS